MPGAVQLVKVTCVIPHPREITHTGLNRLSLFARLLMKWSDSTFAWELGIDVEYWT